MPIDPSKWADLLGQLDASSGGGIVYYIKQPNTRLRLIHPSLQPNTDIDPEDENFFAETTKHYQGKASTAFLVWATVIGTTDKKDQNVNLTKVRAVRLPKTALRAILSALADEHELFDPEEGHAIKLDRVGGGNSERTSYIVNPSPKPVRLDVSSLEWPEDDLWTIAEQESQRSAERDAKKAAGGDVAGRRGGRNIPKEVDEDDEDLPF